MGHKPTYQELAQRVKQLEEELSLSRSEKNNRKLIDSESRYKALSEAAHEGIFITENGICIEANQAGCNLFGYSITEIIGMHALSIFTDETKDIVLHNIKNEVTDSYEAVGVRKDGSLFNAEIRGQNYNYQGRNVRIAAIRDITEQKTAETALKESEAKFREVVENAGDGILLGNLNGEIIDANHGFLKMTGFDRDEIVGQHISKIFDPKVIKERPLRFDLLNKGQSIIIERDIVGKNKELIPIEMNSKRPHANYYLSIIRDLRERKKAEKDLKKTNIELRQAKEKAEESDRLKSAFLANMSHEIRTPMNGILGFSELLKDENCDVKSRNEYINVIIESGMQLLNIINDVLEISRIETGQIKVEHREFLVNKAINDIASFFQQIVKENHNTLVLDIPENTDQLVLKSDESKLKQVLTNLINNALKFTLNGKVTVGYSIKDGFVQFYVKDTGIGIPDDFMNKIFDRFRQVEYNDQIKQSGTGLGLSICQKLIELMSGEIWVTTEKDKGSTFYFTLPIL
ncbi:PAS domain S-box protein [Carboxylicivirga sp. N1Y90]|uniref:PAS domain S-box protein n=1 Tax=Carboxylicivirga fragile TaxID=3417571 RepID=UPI003D33149C|nr:PAS domain S-box protein [Marinilabiliaceae bacterium N1Y90]